MAIENVSLFTLPTAFENPLFQSQKIFLLGGQFKSSAGGQLRRFLHLGPFAHLDIIGLTTAYNIVKMEAEHTRAPMAEKKVQYLQDNFIAKNKLGVATGEGFYKYPNPAYLDGIF